VPTLVVVRSAGSFAFLSHFVRYWRWSRGQPPTRRCTSATGLGGEMYRPEATAISWFGNNGRRRGLIAYTNILACGVYLQYQTLPVAPRDTLEGEI